VRRLEKLAALIAPDGRRRSGARGRAARLAKADLATAWWASSPELQGVMGRYYALHGGEDARVAEAIGAHYRPLGPTDEVPNEPVAVTVALADKLDQLASFFALRRGPPDQVIHMRCAERHWALSGYSGKTECGYRSAVSSCSTSGGNVFTGGDKPRQG
jgi:hypothetical protein